MAIGDFMNRLTLTKLLKNIIDLYTEGKFTYIYIIDTFEKLTEEEFDEDKNAYLQAELISTLFKTFPYYRLLNDLNTLGDYIIESTKGNSNYKNVSKLLKNGCLGDMVPDIKRRVQTETMAHITELLYMYKKSELNPTIVMNHLTKNMFDPRLLTSMDTAESINYSQTTLPGISIKKTSLRDAISRSNGNRKDNVRKNLEEYTLENFDVKSLEDFINQVKNIIIESTLEDKEILNASIKETLTNLYSKAVIIWSEQSVDPNQLTLTLK